MAVYGQITASETARRYIRSYIRRSVLRSTSCFHRSHAHTRTNTLRVHATNVRSIANYRPTVRPRKRSHAWVAISLTLTSENWFLQFEQKCYWEIKQSKRCFIFPPRLTSVSALCTTWWNRKPENVYFHLNAACCFANKHAKHIKYYIVTVEPPFTVKTIDCTHQTGPEREHSILQQVTPTVDIYQVCHAVGHNVN